MLLLIFLASLHAAASVPLTPTDTDAMADQVYAQLFAGLANRLVRIDRSFLPSDDTPEATAKAAVAEETPNVTATAERDAEHAALSVRMAEAVDRKRRSGNWSAWVQSASIALNVSGFDYAATTAEEAVNSANSFALAAHADRTPNLSAPRDCVDHSHHQHPLDAKFSSTDSAGSDTYNTNLGLSNGTNKEKAAPSALLGNSACETALAATPNYMHFPPPFIFTVGNNTVQMLDALVPAGGSEVILLLQSNGKKEKAGETPVQVPTDFECHFAGGSPATKIKFAHTFERYYPSADVWTCPMPAAVHQMVQKGEEVKIEVAGPKKVLHGTGLFTVSMDSRTVAKRNHTVVACMKGIYDAKSIYWQIPQFVEFYSMLGVSHFNFYIDGLRDDVKEALAMLQPYIEKDLVTLRVMQTEHLSLGGKFNDLSLETVVTTDCAWRNRGRAKWVMNQVDLDEFFTTLPSFSNVNSLTAMLDKALATGNVASVHIPKWPVQRPPTLTSVPNFFKASRVGVTELDVAGKIFYRPELSNILWVHTATNVQPGYKVDVEISNFGSACGLLHFKESDWNNHIKKNSSDVQKFSFGEKIAEQLKVHVKKTFEEPSLSCSPKVVEQFLNEFI